jgi:hypothetical protein
VKAKKSCNSLPTSAVESLKKKVDEFVVASSIDAKISSADAYWLPQVSLFHLQSQNIVLQQRRKVDIGNIAIIVVKIDTMKLSCKYVFLPSQC